MGEWAALAYWDANVTMTPAAARLRDGVSTDQLYATAPLDLTYFLSCYNEANYVVETLETISEAAKEVGLSFEIIVVDDCSRDNSVEILHRYLTEHPDDNIVLRENLKGLAQNYVDVAFLGCGKHYRLICGDGPEPKESIVSILRAIGEADCIVPYHVGISHRSSGRRLLSATYTAIINAITGNRLHYYNGLAVHLRRNVMRWHTNTRGFGFQAEILTVLLDLGFTYKEVPVIVREKREGKSNALTLPNLLSIGHTFIQIASHRLSTFVYGLRGRV
jgi:glycosyltransferase involved in cell wall biosynthesis